MRVAAHALPTSDSSRHPNPSLRYQVESVDAMAFARAKTPVRWEEVWQHFGTLLDQRTIIHGERRCSCDATSSACFLHWLHVSASAAWLSPATVINATSHGYRALWSMDNTYYLDSLDEAWQEFYDQDIIAGIPNASQAALVLGGETAMWGETVVSNTRAAQCLRAVPAPALGFSLRTPVGWERPAADHLSTRGCRSRATVELRRRDSETGARERASRGCGDLADPPCRIPPLLTSRRGCRHSGASCSSEASQRRR